MIPSTASPRFVRLAAFLCLAANGVSAGIVTYSATGATPAAITATRDAFRSAVGGGTVAGANGDFGGLRREINWDGVPAGSSDPNLMPGNFFNTTSPRGVEFTTPGTGFLVSAAPGGATPTLFGFPADLQTFSAAKLFASTGSNLMDISFFVPGTSTAATTSAFAAVFVDVETADSTQMEFFDENGILIFSQYAAPAGNQGLSFLGGVADAGERIARVRIVVAPNFLVSNGVRNNESVDFVVMDDFLYATPTATGVPEPGSLGLLALGGLLTAAIRRKR
jgi:PEP-CTERM motif